MTCLPHVGDVYQTSLHDARVLICLEIRELSWGFGTNYTFFVLDDGNNSEHRGSSFRHWTSGSFTTSDMREAMKSFSFEKIASTTQL